MSNSKNARKLPDITKLVTHTDKHNEEGEVIACNPTESCTYAVLTYASRMVPNCAAIWEYKTRCHTAGIVRDYLHYVGIPVLVWPARSPDLNLYVKSSLKPTKQINICEKYHAPVVLDPLSSIIGTACNIITVTVSKKPNLAADDETPLCSGQKSFISIHSTDQLCQVADIENPANLEECNVEVLSLNEVFPSTSEESLSNEDERPAQGKERNRNKKPSISKCIPEKTTYAPTNSKSSTSSGRPKEPVDSQPSVYSDFDIPKNTMYVIGSNPGEPKMSYQDPPKKISKTMKKFLRNIDKHKSEQSKSSEKAISKLTTMRGILKDGRCGPECTGDSVQGRDEYSTPEDLTLPFTMDFCPPTNYSYSKQNPDKNVTFNTQVVIIHFTGDLCVGQSVETLSKEKDQQARNSELRKTFLTKYNEHWPTQK